MIPRASHERLIDISAGGAFSDELTGESEFFRHHRGEGGVGAAPHDWASIDERHGGPSDTEPCSEQGVRFDGGLVTTVFERHGEPLKILHDAVGIAHQIIETQAFLVFEESVMHLPEPGIAPLAVSLK